MLIFLVASYELNNGHCKYFRCLNLYAENSTLLGIPIETGLAVDPQKETRGIATTDLNHDKHLTNDDKSAEVTTDFKTGTEKQEKSLEKINTVKETTFKPESQTKNSLPSKPTEQIKPVDNNPGAKKDSQDAMEKRKTSSVDAVKKEEIQQKKLPVATPPPLPKAKVKTLPLEVEDGASGSLYQDARSQLKRVVTRQISRGNVEENDSEEEGMTPIDRLIRQGSFEPNLSASDSGSSLKGRLIMLK